MTDVWSEFTPAPPRASNAVDPWAEFTPASSHVGPNITIRSAAAETSEPNTTMDVLKSAGTGVAKGVIDIAGIPGDISELGAKGLDMATRYIGGKLGYDIPERPIQDSPFGSAAIQRTIEGVTGEFHKPETTAGEYAQTVGEFAPGALVPGGIAARAGQVVVPAVASEYAGQLTKGTPYEPYARFIGAAAGGVGASMLSRPGTAGRAIQQQLPAGVTPQMVDQAQALMQQARQQGIDLAWPEALSQVAQRPVLTNVMRHLEASPQTEAQMSQFFGNRPQQVETAARGQFDQIAPVNQNPSSIGREVRDTADNAVGDVRHAINDMARPYYDSASTHRLTQQEMAQIRAVPGYAEARAAVRNDPQLNRNVAHLPDDSVGFLNEVKKVLDQQGQNAGSRFAQNRNQQRAAGLTSDATTVRGVISNASPDYRTALDIQTQGRQQFLQPLLDGPLGSLAKRDTTTKKAIDALFLSSPVANSEREIETAVHALAVRNPRAASDLVRAHVETTFNNSAEDLQTGANQAGGAKFRTQLVGNSQQAANLQAAVEALPNGAQRWQGFNRFLDIMEAIGTRQGIGSRTSYNDAFTQAQRAGGLIRDTAETVAKPLEGLKKYTDRYEQWKLGKNLGQLANVLTDPGSTNLLRAIAKAPSGRAAEMLALRLAVYTSASKPKPINETR